MKILLVDDSELLQERLKKLIMKIENVERLDQAFKNDEAIKKISKTKYDVIISDIRMPGGGGFELLSHIRKTDKSVVVIIITNYPYLQYKQRALELGANYFISKSEELDNLVPVLRELNNKFLNTNPKNN